MAVSMKKKGFAYSNQPSGKMCLDRYTNMSAPQLSWPVPMRAIGAQNLLTMPGGVTTSGYLHKKGGSQFSLMKWPLRYTIIHKGCVYYFKTSTSATPQGAFSLSGYNRVMRAAEETTSSNVFPFKVVHFSKRHRTWYFSAASEDERRKWMCHLRREIDHYNDRRDTCVPSDSDSDAESFYGPIECPLDITHTAENPEGDYLLEEDSDEEDYLKPDGPSPTSGRPIAPPPSYPPPPVPYHPHQNSLSALSKGPPPTPPPIPKKPPPGYPVPSPCSLPPSFPPPMPHMPMPHMPAPPVPKPAALRGPPLPSLDSLKKQISTRTASTMPLMECRERRPSPSEFVPPPATLPFVKKPPPFAPPNRPPPPAAANHSLMHKPPPMLPVPGGKPTSPNLSLIKPKLTPPKPPIPGQAKLTTRGPPLQRSSPDGQSFRSLGDEMPSVVKKLAKLKKGGEEDSDEDYENVQLPDSVFVETTETSIVERMYKDYCGSCPQDGLYCFRNSGTKTSKVLVVWDVSLMKARNYRLFEEDSKFFLETDSTFTSLAELVEYYHGNPLPNHGSLCLQKPYGYTPPR